MRIADRVRQSHLIGIGGYGMSALARLLHGIGARVSGSDLLESRRVHELRALGVDVAIGHSAENLRLEGGQVIYSAAIPDDCPELVGARRRGLPCLLYSEAVGRLSEEVRTLAIAGTHGKTSTTALTVAALRAAGLDPSFLIGGEVPCLAGNGYGGGTELLVVEACEFNRSFHELRPAHAAILNLERDHFDCYPSREALEESFALYANKLRPGGSLLLHETVPDSVVDCLPANIAVIRIGSGLFADLRALDVAESFGRFAFTPSWDGERLPRVDLKLLGAFQVWNALFALGLAIQAGAEPDRACDGLVSFDGVERRFQRKLGARGGELIDDYAHLPSEIRAVICTVRKAYPGRRILVAFQPHQHSRTRHLLEEFGQALAQADYCLVADIFAAREDPSEDHGVGSEDLVAAIRRAGGVANLGGSTEELGERILSELRPGYVPVVLGAGELDGVVEEVVRGI